MALRRAWKLGRYRRRQIFAFAMLSTSQDDAFSNNLRQYDALWFVNGRKPGDREDGKASERRLYPFRNALITYLRDRDRLVLSTQSGKHTLNFLQSRS